MTRHFPLKLAIAFFLISCASASAQEQLGTPPGQVERKNRAPVSNEVLKVKLPRAKEATLSNGLKVMILEDHRLPKITVEYDISGSSSVFEPRDMTGLASVTAQMMTQGTKTRTSRQIAEDTEVLGATVSASTRFGSALTAVSASGFSDNFEKWFALANDVLLNPSFPADELDRLKQRLKITLRQQRTSPGFLMSERFAAAVYGDHPAANVSVTAATIDALTPALLAKWHSERFVPQNTILGISGDVKATELIPRLETLLGGWKKTDLKEVLPPGPRPATARRIHLVDRPDAVQTNLMMGNLGIDRRDPDFIALSVMSEVLGGGSSRRLFLKLREEKGYTYGAYSSISALKYPGRWIAYADVRTEVTEGALTEFMNEFRKMRDELVPEKELEEAKRSIVASFALSLEDAASVLSDEFITRFYDFPDDYWDTYPVKVMAITPADIQRMARKYITPDLMQIVAVGDASKIKPILEKFGSVDRYDVDGKKLP